MIIWSFFLNLERIIVQKLSKYEFFEDHFNDPISSKISTVAVLLLIVVLTYQSILNIGVFLKLWDSPGKEFFPDKPIHCAHVYFQGNVVYNHRLDKFKLPKSLRYHLEFSPEDFEGLDDPELGSTLGFTRKKLYFLFKDSEIYKELNIQNHQFKISDVFIFNRKKELKHQDDNEQLCLLGIETGFVLFVIYNINTEDH